MNKEIIQVMFKFRLEYIYFSCNKCGQQFNIRPPIQNIICACGNRITINDYECNINWIGTAKGESNER